MKMISKKLCASVTVAFTALALASCGTGKEGGEAAEAEAKNFTTAEVMAQLPDYYPADYAKLIDQSRKETGLLIYGNVAEYNWREILVGFKEHYPWIKVATLDLGPNQAFERYYSEESSGKPGADMFVVAAPDAWLRFSETGGPAEYVSPEADKVPDWSKPLAGVYTVAADPMIMIYNKVLLSPEEYPTSLSQLADEAQADPGKWRNKITTYDATSHSFAYAIHWSVVDHGKPAGWALEERLAPFTRPETGGSTMLDKVMGGEYLAAFFTSGITVFPKMNEKGRSDVLGYALPTDGTPLMLRGMAVTKSAKSPASARLLLDFMLSHEGQVDAGKGGMTPYRPDVSPDEVPFYTYSSIVKEVGGEENLVIIGYDPKMSAEYTTFIKRWGKLFKGQ